MNFEKRSKEPESQKKGLTLEEKKELTELNIKCNKPGGKSNLSEADLKRIIELRYVASGRLSHQEAKEITKLQSKCDKVGDEDKLSKAACDRLIELRRIAERRSPPGK